MATLADKLAELKRLTEEIKAEAGSISALAQSNQQAGVRHIREARASFGLETAIRDFAGKVNTELLKDASIVASALSTDVGKRGSSTTVYAFTDAKTGIKYTVSASWKVAGSPSVVRRESEAPEDMESVTEGNEVTT